MILTDFFRPMPPLWSAQRRLARSPLDSSSAVTTAASVVASSAHSTLATKSALTSLRASIPKVTGTVHVIVATAPSASGSISAPAELTARALTAADRPRQSRFRLPRLRSGQIIPAWAAWRRASRGPGTGALSKHLAPPLPECFAAGPCFLLMSYLLSMISG